MVNMFQLLPFLRAYALLAGYSVAQQYPPPVTYDTILKSPVNPNITISYKQPNPGTCVTAFDTQKQYTGYVNLPPFTLTPYQQNYSINTFFWFFESRTDPETAPLTIWLNGGPGSSSMVGLFEELGPCEVVQLSNGSFGTQSRLWGWDRSSNLLFIDQPTQVGFSYDERVNASVDFKANYPSALQNRLEPQPVPVGTPSWRFMNGTFASGREDHTQDSSALAARACWHFLQGFLSALPQYNPGTRPNSTNVDPTGVNLFAESYGGIYGPTFADFFGDQNDRRKNGSIPASTLEIRLESVGIVSGILDLLTQTIAVANFTYNNNYGINVMELVSFQNTVSQIYSDIGCRGLVMQCRSRMRFTDPDGSGRNENTNQLCENAFYECSKAAFLAYGSSGRSPYDIRVSPEVGPGAAYQEYLNTANVLRSIGAQVNFTQTSKVVFEAFSDTGDSVRRTQLSSLAELLARGVRVAFIYGDADLICNWYGGQNASLELARLVPSYSSTFPKAGYADIVVNNSYIGGQVRQYGNLSFSRIYDAGHLVPYYQPETAFTVFTRIVKGDDIGMGRTVDLSAFSTEGPRDSPHLNKTPKQPVSTCWLRNMLYSCTLQEQYGISQGLGTVKDGVWVRQDETATWSNSHDGPVIATIRHTKTSSDALTGVYTATVTPKSTLTSGSSRRASLRFRLPRQDVSPYGPEEARREATRSRKTRSGLIGGLAAAGGLLLTLLSTLLCCLCCRRPTNKVRALPDGTEKSPATSVRPVREEAPLSSRYPTTMKPISEASPRPSKDMAPVQRSMSIHSKPLSRVSTFVPEPPPVLPRYSAPAPNPDSIVPVQRSDSVFPSAPRRVSTLLLSPPEPSPVLVAPRTLSSPREPTHPLPESTASLPHEKPQRVPTAPLPEPNAQSEPESAASKPSLMKQIRDTFSNETEDAEEATKEGPDGEPTPPARVTTRHQPSRAPTAPVPTEVADV